MENSIEVSQEDLKLKVELWYDPANLSEVKALSRKGICILY